MDHLEYLQYPIGRMPVLEARATAAERAAWIDSIDALPERLRAAVRGLSAEQWQTPYRPGGWTVHQLVHHIPDSHVNAYTRVKLALTEDEPTIKTYEEARWAALADVPATPPEVSLALLDALHRRWVVLWKHMTEADYLRTLHHPGQGRTLTLEQVLAQYAWHSEHHLRHVTALGERLGWGK